MRGIHFTSEKLCSFETVSYAYLTNIKVKEGITVTERNIPLEYILLRSRFSVFYSGLFLIKECVFVLLATSLLWLLTLFAYSAWAQVARKLFQRLSWWDRQRETRPEIVVKFHCCSSFQLRKATNRGHYYRQWQGRGGDKYER